MRRPVTLGLVGVALAMPILNSATAQDAEDQAPQYLKHEGALPSENIGKWFYFVSNDPSVGMFKLEDTKGEANFTSTQAGQHVVETMKLKYIGLDKSGRYYQYQNDVAAGGLIWFLPKAKRGHVYWMYGGTGTPATHHYGRSVRFRPKE